jgi:sec-independent protein translocase protein TatC
MSLGDHLEELRKRLMLGLVGPLVIMIVVAVFFGDAILAFLLEPGHRALEAAGFEPTLPHRHPAEVFNAWMRVCIVSGLIVGIPWLFYQLWMFVAPGLYPHERKVVYRLIPGSILLSAVGVLYLYFLLLPVILDFLLWFSGSLPEPPPPAFAVAPYEGTLPQAPILEADPEVRAPGDWWIRKREVGSLGKPRIVYDLAIDIEGIVRTAPLGRANLSAPLWMLGEYIGWHWRSPSAFRCRLWSSRWRGWAWWAWTSFGARESTCCSAA